MGPRQYPVKHGECPAVGVARGVADAWERKTPPVLAGMSRRARVACCYRKASVLARDGSAFDASPVMLIRQHAPARRKFRNLSVTGQSALRVSRSLTLS